MTQERPTYMNSESTSDKATIANCHFKLQCDQPWEGMALTADSTVRHCLQCDKDVFHCTSLEEVAKHASLGHCIAIVPEQGYRILGIPEGAGFSSAPWKDEEPEPTKS